MVSIASWKGDTLAAIGIDINNFDLSLFLSFDTGQNWQLIQTPFKYGQQIPSERIEVFDSIIYFNVDDSLLKYNFNKNEYESMQTRITLFDFINDSVGFVLLNNNDRYEVFYTTDTGNTWDSLAIAGEDGLSNNIILGIDFLSPAIACIWYTYAPGITCTSDSGKTWNTYKKSSAIESAFISTQNIYAVNEYGEYLFSSDFGKNWTTSPIDSIFNEPWSIFFVNDKMGFACGSDGLIFRTLNAGGVGIKEKNKIQKKIKIFPNPAKQKIHIETEAGLQLKSVILMDSRGKKVKEYNSKNRVLDISELPAGIYFLQLGTKEGFVTEKIVVE